MFEKEQFHKADIDEQKRLLLKYPDHIVDALYDFGTILINEVQQRSGQVDSKFGLYMGYAAAVVAFLGIGAEPVGNRPLDGYIRMATFAAVGFAAVAIVGCMFGMKSGLWKFPSELEWFHKNAISNNELRRQHVLAMLAAHQQHQRENADKSGILPWVEWLLVLATGLSAFVLVMKLFNR